MKTLPVLSALLIIVVVASLVPGLALGSAAADPLPPPQPSDPIESLRQSSQSALAQVAAPDSMPGRVPIILYASKGVAPFRIAPRLSLALRRAQHATFTINYIPAGTQNELGDNCLTWPAGSQAAFTYAANLWGTLLNSSVPIKIDACWASLGEGVLGHSATDSFYRNFTGAPQANTWYSVALANALSGTDQNGNTAEMHIAYSSSSSFTWYFGTDGNPPMGQYDFVSVVLHEIAHGLNFAGSMQVSGGVGSWGGGTGAPVIYDRFAENGSSQALINTGLFPNPSTQLAAQLTSNNIYFNGTYANAANGGQRPKLYAPSTWQQGSSYAHLDYNTFHGTPNALMLWAIDDGTAIHDPGPVTCGIFRDLGWQNPCQTTSPPPTVTSITPNSGNNTGTVHITNLAGSNFQTGAAVKLTKSGQSNINATNVVVVSASQITCDFNLTGTAAGQWNVVVTNSDSQSGTLSNGFTVSFSGKTWNGSVSSDWHTASNWTPSGVPASTDDVLIPDVTRDPIISSSDAVANSLVINSGAVLDLTTRKLMVEGALTNNGTLKQTQTVAGSSPANFLRITNLAGDQTQYYGVDITSSGAASVIGAPAITSAAPTAGFTLSSHNVLVSETVTFTNTTTLLAVNADGMDSATDAITVSDSSAAPTVTSITPNTGVNTGMVHITNLAGSNFQKEITGTNYQPSSTVKLTKSGQADINATNVNVVTATQITCDFDLTGAATGAWDVVVTNPDLQSGTLVNGFTVTGVAGVNVTVSVSGNQFCTGRTAGVKRCFDIAPASALTATVRFYLSEAERNGQTLSELLVWHYGGAEWTEEAGPYTRGGAGDAQYVQAQNVKNFSPFALARTGGGGGPVYLPLIMNRWPPVPDAPTLYPISPNPSLDGNYTVGWAAGTGPAPTSYDLEENGGVILTDYASTSRSFSGKAIGTYTYRVRGKNSYGTGPWSSPQQVTVQAQPSGPTPGFWKGSGVEFYVTSDRAYVHYFAIYITVSGCGSYKIRHNSPDASISGNQFSFSGSFYATGTFDSATAAHGTTGLNSFYVSGCGYVTGSASWSATWQNSSQAIFMPASAIETDTVEPTTVMSEFIVTPVQ